MGAVLVAGGIWLSQPKQTTSAAEATSLVKPSQVTNSQIKVDVSGAVNTPGVYDFSSGDRIEDAIARAGGFATTVDTSYIAQKLNLSAKLVDGQKLYIPYKNDTEVYGLNQNFPSEVAGITSLVGINSATVAQLDQLPGIGPVTAQKIIDNRPYSSLEELISRKIVSQSVFNKIKDKISLE